MEAHALAKSTGISSAARPSRAVGKLFMQSSLLLARDALTGALLIYTVRDGLVTIRGVVNAKMNCNVRFRKTRS
jgi:hypothetical protein